MEIREISAADTLPLRHSILRPHQSIKECIYPGDDDPYALHVGAFHDNQLVTIASVVPEHEPRFHQFVTSAQFRLRGMATIDEFRGRGFGAAVVTYSIQRCWELAGEVYWCNARKTATGFYQKLGFQSLPTEFDVAGIGPHYVMFVEK